MNCNGAELEPNYYQNEENANNPQKTLYQNPGIAK